MTNVPPLSERRLSGERLSAVIEDFIAERNLTETRVLDWDDLLHVFDDYEDCRRDLRASLAQIEQMRAVVEVVALPEPVDWNGWEMSWHCRLCGRRSYDQTPGHTDDCAWLAFSVARAALERETT